MKKRIKVRRDITVHRDLELEVRLLECKIESIKGNILRKDKAITKFQDTIRRLQKHNRSLSNKVSKLKAKNPSFLNNIFSTKPASIQQTITIKCIGMRVEQATLVSEIQIPTITLDLAWKLQPVYPDNTKGSIVTVPIAEESVDVGLNENIVYTFNLDLEK